MNKLRHKKVMGRYQIYYWDHKHIMQRLILLLGSILVIYLRAPILFHHPRFWAEEGTIYFWGSYHLPWFQAILNNRIGYLNLIPSISSTIAANMLDIKYAPFATTIFAFLIQLSPILVILISRSFFWKNHSARIIGVLIVLFIPSTQESWLNTINSQFYLQLTSFLILMDVVPEKLFQKWFYRFLLLMAGLTGLPSLFLIPLFLYSYYREKQKERWIQLLILCFSGLIQTISIFTLSNSNILMRRFVFDIGIRSIILILWTRTIGLVFLGDNFTTQIAEYLYPIVENQFLMLITPILLLLLEISFFYLLINTMQIEKKILWLGGFLLTFLPSVFFSVGSKPKIFLIYPIDSPRYFIVPTAIIMLAILNNIFYSNKNRKIISSFLLSITLFWGLISYLTKHPDNPNFPIWEKQVETWQVDNSYRIKIWPSGWDLDLQPEEHNE